MIVLLPILFCQVDSSLRARLRKFKFATMRKHLTEKLIQANRVREYQLIAQAQSTSQSEKFIHVFYFQMSEYWKKLD